MTAPVKAVKSFTQKFAPFRSLLNQLDGLGILAWGVLMIKYSVSGELRLLIHPNYFGLVTVTGFVLLFLGGLRLFQTGRRWLKRARRSGSSNNNQDSVTHVTVLPLGMGTALLLVTALMGLFITPSVFTSQLAIQRGISTTLPPTQTQISSFATQIKPEERTLVDWVRTISAYPEPDVYAGQKVNVTGFVVHPDYLPDNYILISRFILTCCAVDAYPVALTVRLEGSRSQYPPDTWLTIQGQMEAATLPSSADQGRQGADKRQVVVEAQLVEVVPTPADPYSYAD
ncbi:TIGR03943 family putative permease subunit [Synechocystis sp. CS-94]|nr:TIGR03943 family protein [Synechocystis sp. CS-94]MCT0255035.1 TIGR03943 family protein [Synechocystis sp. CS-94]